ncbi:MAG: hypothetical protein BWY28_02817 [bacterium ADurb.Bin236]|nr:MAG: hypothetical protein BWY28_02817 [bacterium ADurb.Bin236]HOY61981.1 FapA family protein [bacterium]HPN94424.1 FapA family protein [bacterium]
MPDKKKNDTNFDEIQNAMDKFDKQYSDHHKPPEGEAVAIRVSDDEMKVYAVVVPPMDHSKEVTKQDVLDELKKVGVVHGIDEEAINDIFMFGSFNTEVIVAKGTPPSDGVPASIEYKFDTAAEKKAEVVADEHGNVDHRNINLIKSVEEGTILAVKIPAIEGKEGVTCLGEKMPAKEGRDIKMPVGENTAVSDDGLTVIATQSGQPILKDGKINVSAVYEVTGDVSYKTGNINFNGTVIVTGNVQSDFVVNATDDIEIHGNIEKAHIEAGGDVRVRGGLYGTGEGKIIAGGSITIRSVESGILDAGHNIVLGQQARSSILMAGDDIILTNSKGSITGGKASCGNIFDLANVGSPSFTDTVIEIGVNPKIKNMHDEIKKKLEDNKVQFEKISNHIKSLKSKGADGLNDKEKELLKKVVPLFHSLRSSIEADTAKMNFLQDKLNKLDKGRCKVRGKTFPGVKFISPNASMAVRSEINHSSFHEQNEQIVVGPY